MPAGRRRSDAATHGYLLQAVAEEVRREIDWELVDRGVDFMKWQKAVGKPFFLYLPISRTHFPNLPSKRFEGASRIGQFGDSPPGCPSLAPAPYRIPVADKSHGLGGADDLCNVRSPVYSETLIGNDRIDRNQIS